ncbi:hypothetical protein MYX82_11495 [Acidobacteria bacterium AH-259-D05]|nr:hypothetical protein [Acidobacteria bacterium AH-259-D05]
MKKHILHRLGFLVIGLLSVHAAFSFVSAQLDFPYPPRIVVRQVDFAFVELDHIAIFHNDKYVHAYKKCQAALNLYWSLQIKQAQVLDLQSSEIQTVRAKSELMKNAEKLYKEAQTLLKQAEDFKKTVTRLP